MSECPMYVTAREKRVVLLRFFVKKAQKTPKKEIQTAKVRQRGIEDAELERHKK